jgi:hypothetical protein
VRASLRDHASRSGTRCDERLVSISPLDPVANAHVPLDDLHDFALASRGPNLSRIDDLSRRQLGAS